jgi:hypothetical protein
MRIQRNLLLSSAAGILSVTAAQAADLPVKAKPVEYVKVCSLYGAGFYYMPGTDICIKIGGFVRAEASWGQTNGNVTWGPFSGQENNRTTSSFVTRSRGYITADARDQTGYGTVRAYISAGLSTSDTGTVNAGSSEFSSNRAFIQWAGMTTGLTQSFFDFYSAPSVALRAYYPFEDTGDSGWWVWAYTTQLGNGLTATISAEQRRMNQIIGQSAANTLLNGATITAGQVSAVAYGGMQVPDIVANLRVDQTWGSAQVMGALHQVNAQYYTTGLATTAGHPSDAWGWVVAGGLRLNFPMIANGDFFQSEVNYTQGALRYLDMFQTTNFDASMGNQQVFGIQSDCVYGSSGTIAAGSSLAAANTTNCQLTTAWSVNASYEHYWTPEWHQSLVFAYEEVKYNNQANAMLCSLIGGGNGAGTGTLAVATPGCNNNWSMWALASRLVWNISKTFYIGADVGYDRMNSASTFNGLTSGIGLGAPNSPQFVSSEMGSWVGTVRMQKDFLP